MSFSHTPTKFIFVADADPTWNSGDFLPYSDINLSPASALLSYGLSVFDGLKAHRLKDGGVALFRAFDHAHRLANSAESLLMPSFPVDRLVAVFQELVKLNLSHLPAFGEGALYIRPQIFTDEPCLGIKRCQKFKLVIYCSPVEDYFSNQSGLKVKIVQQARVAQGLVGNAKTGCNYASCLPTVTKYKNLGFDDVLFSGGNNLEFLTETSGSNLFVLLTDNSVITPPLDDQILPGITRDSVITLLKNRGYSVNETPVSASDLTSNAVEVFFTGTAWSVVGASDLWLGENVTKTKSLDLSCSLQTELSEIKTGVIDDKHRWLTRE